MVRTLIASSLALLAALVLASAGTPHPSGPTDRSVKLDLIKKLEHGPGILILGDSRGRPADPSFLQQLTGHTGFNAAVTGGSSPDAWVFTRYTADLFPRQPRRYIFFVSQGITADIPDPRMQADPRGRHYLAEVAAYLSTETITPNPWQTDTHYNADGSLPGRPRKPSTAHVERVRQEAAQMVAHIAQYPPGPPQPDPARFQLFEHLIAYMNSLRARPVIVLNPMYPTVFAELQKVGDPLTTASLAYLHGLQARHKLVIVNCQDIHAWGGTDTDWDNPTHVNRINMRRMLRYIVSQSDGALS